MPTPFLGADFRLQSVTPIGLATLRVRYTQDPDLGDSTTGALSIDNYSIDGPALNYVIGSNLVVDDPQAIDLYLAAPLELGVWTLAAVNVEDKEGAPLEDPTSLSFTVERAAFEEPVPMGAVNDDVYNVLRKHFNPALKGRNWDSLLRALAAGDRTNWDNAKRAFDQLFIASAKGLYLDRRAGDQGVRRPPAIAMPDDLFRDLVIVSKTSKLTQDAILEMLEVFYGPEAVRASITTEGEQSYLLENGDDLQLFIDERDVINVVLDRSQFARIGEATALEVAAAISRQLHAAGSNAYAIAYLNQLGAYQVRIYSGRLGISSSIRVMGGKAQSQLLFTSDSDEPDYIFPSVGDAPFATWDITASPDVLGNMRFTLDGTGATFGDFNKIVEGDRVLVYGQEFEEANRGTWEIKRVGVEYPGPTQWFEIESPDGEAQADVEQLFYRSLTFHRPRKRTVYNELRHVIVSQNDGTVEVIIPATTQVVSRKPKTGAYGNLREPLTLADTDGLVRGYNPTYGGDHVLATTTAAHGLSVGDVLLVEGVFPRVLEDSDLPIVTGSPGVSSKSTRSIMSEGTSFGRVYHRGVRTDEGLAVFLGGQTQAPVVATPSAVVYRVTATSYDGQGRRSVNYSWTTLSHTLAVGQQNFGVSVADNRVIATGGHDVGGTPTDAWDVLTYGLSPAVNTLVSGTMPDSRGLHAQTTFDNEVLVCGGFTSDILTEVATANEFDLDTQTWSAIASMKTARMEHEAAALSTGVLVMGGRQPSITTSTCTNTAEFWDGSSWIRVGSMKHARFGFAAVVLPNDRVLVIGGFGYDPTAGTTTPAALASCEIWDGSTRLWSSLPPMARARAYPAAAYVPALNAVVVSAGRGVTSCEILDLDTMTWRTSLAELGRERYRAQAVQVGDDLVIFAGGTTLSGMADDTSNHDYLFVPAGENLWMGGLNGVARVDYVASANTFVYKTPSYDALTASMESDEQTATQFQAESAPENLQGPYVFDPKAGIAITGTQAKTANKLLAGHQYIKLELDVSEDSAPATAFPDEPGWLVFDFGRSKQVWPVRYLGRVSDTVLALDASFTFPEDLPALTGVHLAAQRSAFAPDSADRVSGFYVTASSAGRVAAGEALDDTVAAGLPVEKQIIYPGDRGLGGEGFPAQGNYKLTDAVRAWGGDDLAAEVKAAQEE